MSAEPGDEGVVARTVVHNAPPASLVAAVESKSAEVNANVVLPCRDTNEKPIAAERQREESCSECQSQLPRLAIIEKQTMARCDVKGYDARIADIDARIDKVIARLKSLAAAFERQTRANEALSDEIQAGETEAEATFADAAVGQTMGQLLDAPAEEQVERIFAVEKSIGAGKNVKYASRGEVGAFVAQMRAELAGKSKAQVIAIVSAKLERGKVAAAQIKAVNFATGQVVGHKIDAAFGQESTLSDSLLDGAYGALLTSLQIASTQSKKSFDELAHVNQVLGYSQDTVKISFVFGNLYQLSQNVDGLESLTRAAESQRRIAKSEIDYLVRERATLVAQRNESQSVAGGS